MKLILIADPMCSWCYGFGKEVTELHSVIPQLELEVVVGGLRPGETAVMPREQRVARLAHWSRVESVSGLPFNREAFLSNDNLVYDTEPACRAVVTARRLAPEVDQLAVLRAIQHAFYADGMDVTKGENLAAVGAGALSSLGFPTTEDAFLKEWRSPEAMADTRDDFLRARRWGVSSFPSLLLEDGAKLYNLAPGYVDAGQLVSRVRTVAGSRLHSAA